MSYPGLVFAGNREIGVAALRALLARDWQPLALLVSDSDSEEARRMRAMVNGVPVLESKQLRSRAGVLRMQELAPDYLLSVHHPDLIPAAILDVPRHGALNLHPALLPYNRGWHTPSWSILEGTPYGATLHWMEQGVDSGPIALQRELDVRPAETANELYQRVLELELDLFEEAIPLIAQRQLPAIPQKSAGTTHKKADLGKLQQLDLDETFTGREWLDRLRAMTTNREDEAAYFEHGDAKYWVQVRFGRRTET